MYGWDDLKTPRQRLEALGGLGAKDKSFLLAGAHAIRKHPLATPEQHRAVANYVRFWQEGKRLPCRKFFNANPYIKGIHEARYGGRSKSPRHFLDRAFNLLLMAPYWGYCNAIFIHCMRGVNDHEMTKLHMDILQSLFGNPYIPYEPEPHVLAWENKTVVKLARAVVQDPNTAPVLADALEEAGEEDEHALSHLRNEPVYQGDHVIDKILGRQ